MTTAHRPTWNPTSGGKDQGGNRVIVPTRQYSAKDLPGHTVLKYRKLGQSSEAETKNIDYKEQLIKREKTYFDEKRKNSFSESSDDSVRNPSRSSSNSSQNHPHKARFLVPEVQESREELDSDEVHQSDERVRNKPEDRSEQEDDSGQSDQQDRSEDSDQSDFSEEEILKELEKIKKERAEAAKLKREAEEQKLRDQQKQEMLKKNPLLDITPGFELKRKWTEETIFSNQSRNEPSQSNRFVNDTLRSDFHRKFLHRTIL